MSELLEGKKPENSKANLPLIARSRHLVRVEANFLRLPLFALSTKDLSKRTGIRCQGEFERGDSRYLFDFRATRNTDTAYPGPLSRSVHFAFLDLLMEKPYPFVNPIVWTWGDLCRRLKVKKSGQIVARMKEAIRATAGLMIWSHKAIFVKAEGAPLTTHEIGQPLYQGFEFVENDDNGRSRDRNEVSFADWYLDNLNSLYSCPLNFDLWLALDAVSPIASRLYELLYYRFCRDVDTLQFNYRTLTNLLPITEEKYRSSAEKQLQTAFEHLTNSGIVESIKWADSKTDIGKVVFRRGKLLDLPANELPYEEETDQIAFDTVRVETLTGKGSDEEDVVSDFYRHWLNQPERRATKDELAYARQMLEEHGKTKARALIPLVTELLRKKWPDAKSFGAVKMYLTEAMNHYAQAEVRRQSVEDERRKRREERERERAVAVEKELLLVRWNSLAVAEQEAIRKAVLATNPEMEKLPSFLLSLCLSEMKRRFARSESAGSAAK